MGEANEVCVRNRRPNRPLDLPVSYRDPGSGYEIVITTPRAAPGLWRDYTAGALTSYRAYDVEVALDYPGMQDGRTSSLLFAVLDATGVVVGGMRSQGPYTCAQESHAYLEWGDGPGRRALSASLERMVPEGLVESKTAWVRDDVTSRRDLVACLSRAPVHAAAVLGARFGIGTAAAFSLPGWLRSGGVIDDEVPMVAYPDDRYRTRLLVWDCETVLGRVTDDQREAYVDEAAQLGLSVIPAQRHVCSPSEEIDCAPQGSVR